MEPFRPSRFAVAAHKRTAPAKLQSPGPPSPPASRPAGPEDTAVAHGEVFQCEILRRMLPRRLGRLTGLLNGWKGWKGNLDGSRTAHEPPLNPPTNASKKATDEATR